MRARRAARLIRGVGGGGRRGGKQNVVDGDGPGAAGAREIAAVVNSLRLIARRIRRLELDASSGDAVAELAHGPLLELLTSAVRLLGSALVLSTGAWSAGVVPGPTSVRKTVYSRVRSSKRAASSGETATV